MNPGSKPESATNHNTKKEVYLDTQKIQRKQRLGRNENDAQKDNEQRHTEDIKRQTYH